MNHDDIELGDTPIQVERQPRAGIVVSVRFDADEADGLEVAAEYAGQSLSRLVHDVVRDYLRECHWDPTLTEQSAKMKVKPAQGE